MRAARIRLATTICLGAALVGGLVVTPTAQASITASQITTPADPSFFVADETMDNPSFAISGTTSGGSPAGGAVDVRCYYAGTSAVVAADVALKSDGSFSIPAADMNKLVDLTCRLRAVPAGTDPTDLTPYSGPLVGIGERDSTTVGGGPNDGKLYDYYLYAPQQTAAFDYESLGGCGVNDGYLFDSTYALTTTTFYCNGGLFSGESATPTRSEIQIDGANAYAPAQAESIDANATGLPQITYSYSVDASTGNLVVHEADPLVKCPEATYPPTTTSCSSFVTVGVTDNRTITQDHGGHVSWITDTFTSTDGNAHALDLLWDENQHFWGAFGTSTQVEYEFPGQTSFATHATGDSVSLPAAAPGTILVRMRGSADGDTTTGQGAIVYDRPASAATFTTVSDFDSEFTLGQTATVPPGGSTGFRFAYVQDAQSANVASLAQTARAAFVDTVSVSRTGKGKGTVTSTPAGISCGTTCSAGYPYGTSVTLKARPSRGSAFAGWSGACKGARTCTFTTTGDAAVTAAFVPGRCVVPRLSGKSLRAARRALRSHNCALGKVRHAASRKLKKGRVISQKPKAGKHLAHGARVRLVLSKGKS